MFIKYINWVQLVGIQIYNLNIARIKNNKKKWNVSFCLLMFLNKTNHNFSEKKKQGFVVLFCPSLKPLFAILCNLLVVFSSQDVSDDGYFLQILRRNYFCEKNTSVFNIEHWGASSPLCWFNNKEFCVLHVQSNTNIFYLAVQ